MADTRAAATAAVDVYGRVGGAHWNDEKHDEGHILVLYLQTRTYTDVYNNNNNNNSDNRRKVGVSQCHTRG